MSPDSALYHSMIGYNLYAYCENNPVNYWDPTGQRLEAALGGWMSSMWWLNGVDGPLPIGDAVFWTVVGIMGAVIIVDFFVKQTDVIIYSTDLLHQKIFNYYSENYATSAINGGCKSGLAAKEKYDPNPYGRAGEKKQNRENRAKARKDSNWEPRNNKRDGRPAKPKSHTPSKKGHRKYFVSYDSIKIF